MPSVFVLNKCLTITNNFFPKPIHLCTQVLMENNLKRQREKAVTFVADGHGCLIFPNRGQCGPSSSTGLSPLTLSTTSIPDSLQSSTVFCQYPALIYVHLFDKASNPDLSFIQLSFLIPSNWLLMEKIIHTIPYSHSFVIKINKKSKIIYVYGYIYVLKL